MTRNLHIRVPITRAPVTSHSVREEACVTLLDASIIQRSGKDSVCSQLSGNHQENSSQSELFISQSFLKVASRLGQTEKSHLESEKKKKK